MCMAALASNPGIYLKMSDGSVQIAGNWGSTASLQLATTYGFSSYFT